MATNYRKWDQLEEYDYLSDEETDRANERAVIPTANDSKINLILSWPNWSSERIRWALDKQGRFYHEYIYPIGFDLPVVISYSNPIPASQTLTAPILEVVPPASQREIYRTPTEQLLYLMSSSYSSVSRLYPSVDALYLQEKLEKELEPLASEFFYSIIFTSNKLTEKYLFDQIRVPKIRTMYKVIWPLVKLYIIWKYKLSKESSMKSLEKVSELYSELEKKMGNNEYLCGHALSAADLTLACFSIPILLASQDDLGSKLAVQVPTIKDAPEVIATKVRQLRASKIGKLCIRMYVKDRGMKDKYRSQESRYDPRNSPWWSSHDILAYIIWGALLFSLFLWTILLLLSPKLAITISILVLSIVAFYVYRFYKENSELFERLYFAAFRKPVDPQKKTLDQYKKEQRDKLRQSFMDDKNDTNDDDQLDEQDE